MSKDALKARIAILGAGPAGLAAAWSLKERGYTDVLVLEKLGRVGGLCKSITDGYMSFDLGGNYVTPAYKETLRLARIVGADMYKGKQYGLAFVEGRGKNRKIRYGDIREYVRTDPNTGDRVSQLKILWGLIQFAWLRFKVRKYVDAPTYANIKECPENICLPFDQWLDRNGIGYLKRMFEVPIPMMGYGLLHEIATPYALTYMAWGTFRTMVMRGLPIVRNLVQWPKRFTLGFQRMWELISWRLNVRTEVSVSEIRRGGPKPRPIAIKFTHADQIFYEEQNTETTHYFDRLIVACPLTLEVLDKQAHLDLTEDERKLFAKVDTYSFCQTTLHAVQPGTLEEPFYLRNPVIPIMPFNEESIGNPWVVVQVWGFASRMLQFYSRIDPDKWKAPFGRFDRDKQEIPLEERDAPRLAAEDESRREVLRKVEEILGLMGGEVAGKTDERMGRWRTFHRWPYFGHVSAEQFTEFFPKLEELQGKMGTYYTGGATTFELIEAVVRSAKYVVEKLDADLRADPEFGGAG